MTYRVRNIGIAVALAAVAALMTSFYVTNYKRHVQRGEDHVTVLVAKHDIPAGTAGSDAAGDLTATQVPRRSVVPGAISSPDEIKDKVASQQTFAGEQITTSRFSSVAQTGVVGQLKGTMRAFQIMGDGNQTLAGTLKDNDRVDIVAAFNYKWVDFHGGQSHATSSDTLSASRVVLRDIKVLKAPEGPAAGSKLTGGIDQKFPVLLAVTDSQAQKLLFIVGNASQSDSRVSSWSLELRPVVHAADSPDHVDRVSTILLDGLNPNQRRALVP
jgi:Flp pilus assembly protein CpaB